MLAGRFTAATAALMDGRVLVAGGYSDGSDGYPIPLADAFPSVPGGRGPPPARLPGLGDDALSAAGMLTVVKNGSMLRVPA